MKATREMRRDDTTAFSEKMVVIMAHVPQLLDAFGSSLCTLAEEFGNLERRIGEGPMFGIVYRHHSLVPRESINQSINQFK